MQPADLPFSPAADRNKQPILDVLAPLLPRQARVLEIASGTGQHAAHAAASQPGWWWQPTDGEPAALPAITGWCTGLANVAAPLHLDVLADWPPLGRFEAVYVANLLHISPWATCGALMRGASRCLAPGGVLALYGPFLVDGEPTAPGNLAFDADLRRRNAAWGLRRREAVCDQAARAGFALRQDHPMPANNRLLVFGTRAD